MELFGLVGIREIMWSCMELFTSLRQGTDEVQCVVDTLV